MIKCLQAQKPNGIRPPTAPIDTAPTGLNDVRNIAQCYAQYAPELAESYYAEEMWELHQKDELAPI